MSSLRGSKYKPREMHHMRPVPAAGGGEGFGGTTLRGIAEEMGGTSPVAVMRNLLNEHLPSAPAVASSQESGARSCIGTCRCAAVRVQLMRSCALVDFTPLACIRAGGAGGVTCIACCPRARCPWRCSTAGEGPGRRSSLSWQETSSCRRTGDTQR